MGENIANAGASDVLTSIRALVRKEVESGPHVAEAASLLLSPTHRIASEEGGTAPQSQAVELDRPWDPTHKSGALSTLEATIAELENAVGGAGDFEPESVTEPNLSVPPTAVFRSSQVNKASPEMDSQTEAPTEAQSADPEIAFIPGAVPETKEESAKVEAAVAPLQLGPEQIVSNVQPAHEETLAEDEILLDEEMLAQMVRETVREELKGALGDAITRNIRRLIRREIHAYFDVKDGQ